MQILLQKVVSAMLYGDPILVMDFLKLLVQVRPGMRAPKLNVELIPPGGEGHHKHGIWTLFRSICACGLFLFLQTGSFARL